VRIVVVGVNHASGPNDLRERLTLAPGELQAALLELKAIAREGFIVSTCNRVEVYAVVGHAVSGADALLRFLAERSGVDVAAIRAACYVHAGPSAVHHALRVTSGLDSVVLGEDQIQGQVKRALESAREAGTLGATLDRLGASALACGKRVRTFTGVGRHSVSLESLAVRAASERLAGLRSKRVLVLGAGESASLIARNLESAGARITITSRSLTRARALAENVHGGARRLAELPQTIGEVDAVFACVSAPKPVLTPATLERRARRRRARPLLCVDLGMPRGIDASLESAAGVSVVTLDQLATMAETHRSARREHIPAAESIVTTEAERFSVWLNARGVAQAIAGLNAHADAVAEHEVERVMPRLKSLAPHEREIVAELAHRIVRKLVHRPINALKTHPEAENMALVMDVLFGSSGAGAALNALERQPLATFEAPPDRAQESAS
jgi:glutamyl-tRNA reductase